MKRKVLVGFLALALAAGGLAAWFGLRAAGVAPGVPLHLVPAEATLVVAGRPEAVFTDEALRRLQEATARAGRGLTELTSDAVWKQTDGVAIAALPGNDAVAIFRTRANPADVLADRARAFGFQAADVGGRPGWRRTFMAGVAFDDHHFAVGTIRGVKAVLAVHDGQAPSTLTEGAGAALERVQRDAPLVVATLARPELGLTRGAASLQLQPLELRAFAEGAAIDAKAGAALDDARKLAAALARAPDEGAVDGDGPAELRQLAQLTQAFLQSARVEPQRGGVLVTARAEVDAKALIGAGAGVLAAWFDARVDEANKQQAAKQISGLASALEMYRRRVGQLPPDLATLAASEGFGPLEDAWKLPFHYALTDEAPGFVLCSNGPDRQQGTPDDICAAQVAPAPPADPGDAPLDATPDIPWGHEGHDH